MKFILYNLKLMRVINCSIASLAVFLGFHLTSGAVSYYNTVLMMISIFLACGCGYVLNDIVDIESDRVSHPDRILVKSKLSINYAKKLATVFGVLAIFVISFTNIYLVATVVFVLALIMAYDFKLKKIPLVGNFVVASLSFIVVVSGSLAANQETVFELLSPIFAGLFAFFLHLIREIIKDIIDEEGDRKINLTTLPMIVSRKMLLLFCLIMYSNFVLLTLIPLFSGWFGMYYEVIVFYIIDLVGLILFIVLLVKRDMKTLRFTAISLKVGMVLGMIGLFLG